MRVLNESSLIDYLCKLREDQDRKGKNIVKNFLLW